MIGAIALHREHQIDHSENSSGNYLHHTKDCENCYMLSYHEDCANVCFSGPHGKTILDSLGTVGAEKTYMCSLPVYCYDARYCFSVSHCRFVEYCAYMQNCQYCFGCSGLVNEKYCVFNKRYSESDYHELVAKIKMHMQNTGEAGKFFPGYFAPNPYDESFSGFHFPIAKNDDYRFAETIEKNNMKTAEISEIPDSINTITQEKIDWLTGQVFWDEKYNRPFKIQIADVEFSKKLRVPLPHSYYINRMQNNLKWMPFEIDSIPEYAGRILNEEEYLKMIG
jgi:hypothetical protein